MLKHALQYVKSGWSIFPVWSIKDKLCGCGDPDCRHPGKHPVGNLAPQGFRNATQDSTTIKAWWKNAHWNIGLATGKLSGSLLVIDIDQKPERGKVGSEAWDQINAGYPSTIEAITGSGGRHIYFRYPNNITIRSRSNALAPAIDIRADGGYVILPPSIHYTGKPYAWELSSDPAEVPLAMAPDWLISACCSESHSTQTQPISTQIPLSIDEVYRIRSALCFIASEERDAWLKVGMALHDACSGDQGYGLWREWSLQSEKYDPRDQRKTWDALVPDKGITISTLYWMAQQSGWSPPASSSFSGEITPAIMPQPTTSPEGLTNPPGMLGEITDYILKTAPYPEPVFAVNASLALAATVLGRKVCTETGLRTNLYLISVGPTSSGKDHPRKILKEILTITHLQSLLGGENIASGSGLLTRCKKTPACLFQIDEFGKWMQGLQRKDAGRHSQELLDNLMKLHSSANSIYFGTEYADQKQKPRIDIEYPCVVIHGSTTDIEFYEALSSKHILSGYLNRFIVSESVPQKVYRPMQDINLKFDIPKVIQDWVIQARRITAGGLTGISPAAPVVVPLAPQSKMLFDIFHQQVFEEMRRLHGTGFDAIWGRAWEHAAKVAVICACADDPMTPIVEEYHALWSIRFVSYNIEALVLSCENRISDTPFEAMANDFYNALVQAGPQGVTPRELGRYKPFSTRTPKEKQAIIEALTGAGKIVLAQIRRSRGSIRTAYIAINTKG